MSAKIFGNIPDKMAYPDFLFFVAYSRFAWNPNSIPFFVLVFHLGILIMKEQEKRKKYWVDGKIGRFKIKEMEMFGNITIIIPRKFEND